jgi:hypothetical protein
MLNTNNYNGGNFGNSLRIFLGTLSTSFDGIPNNEPLQWQLQNAIVSLTITIIRQSS